MAESTLSTTTDLRSTSMHIHCCHTPFTSFSHFLMLSDFHIDIIAINCQLMTQKRSQLWRTSLSHHQTKSVGIFLLGDWFWNGGLQKSQKSFWEPLQIIGNIQFWSEDVSATQWNLINDKLGSSAEDTGHAMPFEGAVWKKTLINIKIPVYKCEDNPGIHNYLTTDFLHWSLVSIICEKFENQKHDKLFHYQPSELLWNGGPSKQPIHVHEELHTSEAFIQVHHKLQESQPEPGCELEWVIVTLMFWLTSTHLTSFSNSKLWPCYIFLGMSRSIEGITPCCVFWRECCYHLGMMMQVNKELQPFAICCIVWLTCLGSIQTGAPWSCAGSIQGVQCWAVYTAQHKECHPTWSQSVSFHSALLPA